ncbi:hypothetical protein COCSUDRAFT_60522 [Coccomyxa subellipsoidea C-169]|uniref:Uncharacterized protein n=1 Tax=Coccomyxa subellipsoidea (strain C-169) TaxID=574566 RepID=I0YID0_COCSC|nr:hypothetical protein COCSUDRAFT_60522 [Coccomyxa subellipsoidea C-169]EIE18149.1 hypothetical protein COCSUDRAFT_60522 [Coccomyxa subellipsoidea C-169]|eukprot:XP_005642693.1 hypothetical protein COCSUDRAFT_60522 [Coccomyxa subellipsoidea C-169]
MPHGLQQPGAGGFNLGQDSSGARAAPSPEASSSSPAPYDPQAALQHIPAEVEGPEAPLGQQGTPQPPAAPPAAAALVVAILLGFLLPQEVEKAKKKQKDATEKGAGGRASKTASSTKPASPPQRHSPPRPPPRSSKQQDLQKALRAPPPPPSPKAAREQARATKKGAAAAALPEPFADPAASKCVVVAEVERSLWRRLAVKAKEMEAAVHEHKMEKVMAPMRPYGMQSLILNQ